MRILVIGGTRFVGRHLVRAALDAGHEVTLFNRGVTNPGLFPEVEHVRGDRKVGGLAALRQRRFDAILDPSAYFPADVEAASAVDTDCYLLVSSGSVYRDPVAPGSDETAPVHELSGPVPDTIDSSEMYGALKVLCEREASRRFEDRCLVLRCGLVIGPHDHTERFVYWPRRAARGGRILAADAAQPVQFIDARDLGAWTAALVEAGATGVFNTVCEPLTFADLLAACGARDQVVWAGDRFLLDQGVEPWTDLPLWLQADLAGFLAVDTSRARAAGLRTRPPEETIADVLEWDSQRDPSEQRDALSAERERALERWDADEG